MENQALLSSLSKKKVEFDLANRETLVILDTPIETAIRSLKITSQPDHKHELVVLSHLVKRRMRKLIRQLQNKKYSLQLKRSYKRSADQRKSFRRKESRRRKKDLLDGLNKSVTATNNASRKTPQKSNENSRVLLHFGSPSVLRRILISASILNMTQGEHAYVALLPFFNEFFGTFTWLNNDPYDEIIRSAYQSVLLLVSNQVSGMQSPRLQELTSEWKNLSLSYYNGTASHDLPHPFLISTYAAIEIVGKILDESRADIEQHPQRFSSGLFLAQNILNRSFNLQVGQINITAHGERSPNLTVSYFCPSSNQFEVFLESQSIDERLSLVKISQLSWFAHINLPPNEPPCGYKGDRCIMSASQSNGMYGLPGIVLLIGILVPVIAFMLRRDENRKIWWQIDGDHIISSSRCMTSHLTLFK